MEVIPDFLYIVKTFDRYLFNLVSLLIIDDAAKKAAQRVHYRN